MKPKVFFKMWSGWPENLKKQNDDEDWWTLQFHLFPFVMFQICDECKICFGWLFWSGMVYWYRNDM